MSRCCKLVMIILTAVPGFSACAPSVRDLTIEVAPQGVTVSELPYIKAGDELRVRVIDPAFSNRYVARDSSGALVAMDPAALYGAGALGAIEFGFPITRTPADMAALAEAKSPTFSIAGQSVSESRELYVNERIQLLRARVRADPAERARLFLLTDTLWRPTARSVATDAGPSRIREMLAWVSSDATVWQDSLNTYTDSLARLDTAAWARELNPDSLGKLRQHYSAIRGSLIASGQPPRMLSAETFYRLQAAAERYSRRLAALRAIMPVEQLAGLDTSSVPRWLHEIDVVLNEWTPSADFNFEVAPGLNLRELFMGRTDLQTRVSEVSGIIGQINGSTSIVAAGMTALPRWVVNHDTSTVLTRVYPGDNNVRVTVIRRDRFSPWVAAATGAKPAAAGQTVTGAGTTITTVTTIAAAGATPTTTSSAPSAAGFTTLASPATNDTVAVVFIPVLQRYRFRLGAGVAYSTLKGKVWGTRPDSTAEGKGDIVQFAGEDQDRILPVALLSYTIAPLRGRTADARVPWRGLNSMSIHAGVSLEDPAEQLLAGLGFEILPGLEIGLGYHWAYVTTTRYGDGQFVPYTAGAAVTKHWDGDFAGSVTLDAATFVKAFGGVLGL